MVSYAAFLRGVSPMNAKMPEVKKAFEAAGFKGVQTVLSSGNVVFSAAETAEAKLARKAEAGMTKVLGKPFLTFVRRVDDLERLLSKDPYDAFELHPSSKRIVTFLVARPKPPPLLPIVLGNARILLAKGTEVFSVYVSGPEGPVFMTLIEKTFGKDVTTRTWETVKKVVQRSSAPARAPLRGLRKG